MIMPPSHSPPKMDRSATASRNADRPVVRTYLSVFNNDVSEVVSAINVPYVFLSKPGCSSIARPVYGSRRRPAVLLGVRPCDGHVTPTATTDDGGNKLINIPRFRENFRRTTRITNRRIARGQEAKLSCVVDENRDDGDKKPG